MKVNINLELDTLNENDQIVLENILGGISITKGENKADEKVVVKRAKRSTKKDKQEPAPEPDVAPEQEVGQTPAAAPVAPLEPEPEIEVEPEVEAPEPQVTESPEVRIDALRNSCANKVRTMARKQQREEIVKLFTKLGIQKVSTATDAQIVSLAEELKDVAEE